MFRDPRQTIEVPEMHQFNALASDVASLRAQVQELASLSMWVKFFADPKAGKRIDELSSATVKTIEAMAKLERERAALDQRFTQLDAGEKELRAREVALHQD